MNCDLVFEILTRGPFPSGEPTDASVELHLTRCHDCRRLAEALRPAVELFHEALSDSEDARSLPGYYGVAAAADEPAPAAILTASAWTSPVVREASWPATAARASRWDRLNPLGQIACGAGVGAALCLALAFLVTGATSPPRPAGEIPAVASEPVFRSPASPEELRVVLASLPLPAACFRPASLSQAGEDVKEGGGESSSALLCCTECHNAQAARRPAVSAVALLQREACGVCHRWQ